MLQLHTELLKSSTRDTTLNLVKLYIKNSEVKTAHLYEKLIQYIKSAGESSTAVKRFNVLIKNNKADIMESKAIIIAREELIYYEMCGSFRGEFNNLMETANSAHKNISKRHRDVTQDNDEHKSKKYKLHID